MEDMQAKSDFSRGDTIEMLRKLAESGGAQDMAYLGLYLLGNQHAYDGEAVKWLSRAAEDGDAASAYILGNMYTGRGLDKDTEKAVRFLEIAARDGNVDAMLQLARICKEEDSDFSRFSASHWAGMAAWSGSDEGLYLRISMAREDRNFNEARYLCKQAWKRGLAAAAALMGEMFFLGEGLDVDYGKAMHWYMKAAESGNLLALARIRHMYERGLGVPEDEEVADLWQKRLIEAITRKRD